MEDVRRDLVDAKNHFGRQFDQFTQNFYIMKASLRYFAVKKKMSFKSSDISESFPVNTPVAGSCLKVLNELDVVNARTESSSPNRYMPRNVDLKKMMKIEEILVENREIPEFLG